MLPLLMFDSQYLLRYIHSVSWEVEYTDEFGNWWETLGDAEQESIAAVVGLLEDLGPQLGYPHSSSVTSSKHGHMAAVLLLGGDKTGNDRWYEEFVPMADRLYDAHVATLRREGLI